MKRTPPFVVKPYMFGEDCIGNDPAPTDEDAPDYNRAIQEWFRRQQEHWATLPGRCRRIAAMTEQPSPTPHTPQLGSLASQSSGASDE